MSSVFKSKKLDKVALKSRVLKAAAAAFYEKGIKSVRMDDLAVELSISKRTLYELFADKEEILLEVVKAHNEEVREYIREVECSAGNVLEVILSFYAKAIESLQTVNRAFFEDVKKYPKVVAYQEGIRKENRQSTLAFYKKGVEQGIFRDDVNFRIMQVMLQGQMNLVMQSDIGHVFSLAEIFETMVFMHLRGISTEKGLKIVNDYLLKLKQQKLETI